MVVDYASIVALNSTNTKRIVSIRRGKQETFILKEALHELSFIRRRFSENRFLRIVVQTMR